MAAAAYYNEIDPYAADWLRNLIAAGHIAPGDVDERSIEDVHPDDLRPYTQCHFFAGIGVWSYALRRAGWADDRPVWTGSCPCQPFSEAGKGAGFDDERHLWPDWHWLIQECRPSAIFSEQVASKDAEPWLDLVSSDLEALGFAVGAVAFPSASVGAPHMRDRTYFVAHAPGQGLQGCQFSGQRLDAQCAAAERGGRPSGLADPHGGQRQQQPNFRRPAGVLGATHEAPRQFDGLSNSCASDGRLAEPLMQQRPDGKPGISHEHDQTRRHEGAAALAGLRGDLRPRPVNGFWRTADWLFCRDGKWRPVEPGTFPLAHGAPARVGRLRAYGNAINAVQAQIFIEECMRCI